MASAKIASVHFNTVREDLSQFGAGFPTIPALPKLGGEPVIVEIKDSVQVEEGPFDGNSKRTKHRYFETGRVIAAGLIKNWAKSGFGMTADSHPGLWVVREWIPDLAENGDFKRNADGVAQWRDATPEECAAMFAEDLQHNRTADQAYANWLYNKWNPMWEKHPDLEIPPVVKAAARHYGFRAEWIKDASAIQRDPCKYCGLSVIGRPILCQHCGGVLDIERWALEQKRQHDILVSIGLQPQDARVPTPRPVNKPS